jgi:O-antigen biosynthesis protein
LTVRIDAPPLICPRFTNRLSGHDLRDVKCADRAARCAHLRFAISSSFMARLVPHGKYLFEGAQKFYIRGVSYGPFAPNSRGERYPEPERAAADFALMSRLGANVIRLYVPPPPWMVEEAQKAGLRMMLGIPWPFHMAFLDSPGMMREIRDAIRKTVLETRNFGETIAAYSIGNEIRSDIVRWHGPGAVSGFLAELHDLGKQIDPDALFTYSNYPSAEYLDLSFLDFISFNVYLHREEDFRHYLTHLMGQAGERPLVLSETGMDTIREGEEHQAELLAWQCRAAFELGLSGFIVFAFTDEWHTGGSEITDWAFGLTRRDRSPKLAFDAVAKVFGDNLPPTLAPAPKASVIVPAYNAAATLGECLASIREQNYPDYETIVIDDGSTDSTLEVARQDGVRAVRIEHAGLAAARNAGLKAASGEIVAFIDADARADRDWLYHLVETIVRRDVAAAAGPNFAPAPVNARAVAMASAPGLPREVRAAEDRLAQLCGCNMAITMAALAKVGGFDPMFTAAGDDVDLSWRLAASNQTLAYAPGAVVIHERRATLAAYLRQQRGYGAGEGLLFRKYPLRIADEDGIYAGPSWIGSLLGGARVYYGAFGRGLFQTVYSAGNSYAELPLTIQWISLSLIFLILGVVDRFFGVLGGAGIAISMLAAAASAASAPIRGPHAGASARFYLWIVNLLGPTLRSLARERVKWRFEPTTGGTDSTGSNGRVEFAASNHDSAQLIAATRDALVRHGLAVAETDGFQSYDLEIVVAPTIRVPLNALRQNDGTIAILWRLRSAPRRALIAAAVALVVLLAAGFSLRAGIVAVVCAAIAAGLFAINRARRIPAIIRVCAAEAAASLGISMATEKES